MATPDRPPRDNLYRASFPGVELRDAGDGAATMTGHFAVFDQWTEINSIFEGRFLERISPGAFKKTFQENRDKIKVLFQHGHDPQVGDKPLGSIEDLGEDERGAAYDVSLLDTSYVRDILPGLREGLYGASFRFRVIREDVNQKPKRSSANPQGIPERTIKEAEVMEFGPVTFPAYEGASAGVRSLTDRFTRDELLEDPDRLRELLGPDWTLTRTQTSSPEEGEEPDPDAERAEAEENDAPPTDSAEAQPHPVDGSREPEPLYGSHRRKGSPEWRL